MKTKRTIEIADLPGNHVRSLSEDDLSKIQGGLLLRTQQRGVAVKETIEIESFSWGATQTGGF